mmetsp:Transcript_23710/g.53917  ORF Transcript_23710/g.53917 Transcript_23710/m.53917 type:complete len:275 (+) Transcript_23710:5131-5955(+)
MFASMWRSGRMRSVSSISPHSYQLLVKKTKRPPLASWVVTMTKPRTCRALGYAFRYPQHNSRCPDHPGLQVLLKSLQPRPRHHRRLPHHQQLRQRRTRFPRLIHRARCFRNRLCSLDTGNHLLTALQRLDFRITLLAIILYLNYLRQLPRTRGCQSPPLEAVTSQSRSPHRHSAGCFSVAVYCSSPRRPSILWREVTHFASALRCPKKEALQCRKERALHGTLKIDVRTDCQLDHSPTHDDSEHRCIPDPAGPSRKKCTVYRYYRLHCALDIVL